MLNLPKAKTQTQLPKEKNGATLLTYTAEYNLNETDAVLSYWIWNQMVNFNV